MSNLSRLFNVCSRGEFDDKPNKKRRYGWW